MAVNDSGIFDDTILSVISIAIIGLNSVIILMSYLVIKKNIKGKIKYQILLILIIIPLFNMILLTLLYIYNFENMKNTLELYSMFCLIISFIINVTNWLSIVASAAPTNRWTQHPSGSSAHRAQ